MQDLGHRGEPGTSLESRTELSPISFSLEDTPFFSARQHEHIPCTGMELHSLDDLVGGGR